MTAGATASPTRAARAAGGAPHAWRRRLRESVWAVLALAGAGRLFRYRNRRRILIVMYHGVVEGSHPTGCWSQLPAASFRRQLRYLKAHYTILPLAEIVERLRRAEPLPPYTAAITFDDGFRNNHSVAYPLLAREALPATIFLATGVTGTSDLLWADHLFVAFRDTARDALDLQAVGLGRLEVASAGQRRRAYRTVVAHLKTLPVEEKTRLFKIIVTELGRPDPSVRGAEDFALLSWEQVAEMRASGLIRFGAHTEHHEILSRLEPTAMHAEISASCAAIRARLGETPVLFAYPNGGPADFNDAVRAVVRRSGAAAAVSTIEGLNGPETDLYALRRIGVADDTSLPRFALLCSGVITWLRARAGSRSEAEW